MFSFILCFIFGFVFGVIIMWTFVKVRFGNGVFNVNESDMDKDVYRLVIDDFDKLHRRRYLVVRITRK